MPEDFDPITNPGQSRNDIIERANIINGTDISNIGGLVDFFDYQFDLTLGELSSVLDSGHNWGQVLLSNSINNEFEPLIAADPLG